jgi:hypothetical protein
MTEVFYTDERTNSLWVGINPRGCYIDLKRVSDGFTMENVHSVGHHINGIPGAYQQMYRNKTTYVKFQHRSIFRKGSPIVSRII